MFLLVVSVTLLQCDDGSVEDDMMMMIMETFAANEKLMRW